MKKYIILLAMLLISVAAVSAADLEFGIETIKGDVESGESAQFLIKINSTASEAKEVRLYSLDVEWDVPTEIIKVYPGSENTHKVVITPSKYVEPGKIYGVKLNFKDDDTDELLAEKIAEVNVKSSDKAVSNYRPSVRMEIEMPTNINPKEGVTVRVRLENQNLLNLSDMTLKVSSDIGQFNVEQPVELVSLGKKVVELNYNLDPLQEPGDYSVVFELIRDGEAFERESKTATISSVSPGFAAEEVESGFLFKTVVTQTYTSSSNVEDTQTIQIPTNAIKSLFTSTSVDSESITTEEGTFLVMDLTLKPGETKDVTITTSYRILIYLLIAALLIVGIYLRYRSPLKMRKGVSDVNSREGGVSELKVTLEISNTDLKKPIKKVTVTDYIPNIANVQKEFGEGTLRPTRVFKHRSKGTVLKWEIDEIAPGEDRLISYTMKSKLSIVGDFKVPRAKVMFKKKGRELTAYSNQVGVSS